jgi:hypothetical protein
MRNVQCTGQCILQKLVLKFTEMPCYIRPHHLILVFALCAFLFAEVRGRRKPNSGIPFLNHIVFFNARELKQQGCSGNTAKSWSVYPLCEACAVPGFESTSVRQTKALSKRSARSKKRARPAPAARGRYNGPESE